MWRGGSCVIPRSDEKQDSGAKSYATMTLIANFSENQRNKSTKEQMAVFVNLYLSTENHPIVLVVEEKWSFFENLYLC